MKPFMDEDFLLQTNTAKELYHEHAEGRPIIDFHNHLDAAEIAQNKGFTNLADVWLGGDHYKWRAMRACGIDEKYITGDASPEEKYNAWAETVPNLFGNPLYHWTHLELKRYFGINEPLSPATAKDIWVRANRKLQSPDFKTRELIAMQNVKVLCTTNDPVESLMDHIELHDDERRFRVLPTFRPEKAMKINDINFPQYVRKLGHATRMSIHTFEDMKKALKSRLNYFVLYGCKITDHSLENGLYLYTPDGIADSLFQKRMDGATLTPTEVVQYRSALLLFLSQEYVKHNLVMQLHIGALRNNNTKMYKQLGADAGFDSLDDFNYASQLSQMFNDMNNAGGVPKTIIYCLNPKDFPMIAGMIGNFQDGSIRGKMQLGPAWWFCDHKEGMEYQMRVFSEYGVFSTFVGMLTDSRSFLSFPRHEYFRRILCNYIGNMVENGEYPNDKQFLGKMVENICTNNAANFLGVGE